MTENEEKPKGKKGHKFFVFNTEAKKNGYVHEGTSISGISLKRVFALALAVVLVIASVFIAFNSYRTVQAGSKGVLINWGEAVGVLDEGFHWISPIGQDVVPVSIQIQKVEATESTASSDLQEVTTTVAVNYQIEIGQVLQLYKNLRNDYEARVIVPNIQEALKASTAKYVATALITQRENVKDSFLNVLRSKLQVYGISVLSVSVTDFQFSPSFTAAIEAKVTAEQEALAAQNKLKQIEYEAQQQVIQAQAAANATITTATASATRTVIDANAKAEATIINANATAESIKVVNTQIANSPQYLEYMKIMAWDGQLPTYWGGNGNLPFVYIPTNSTLP